MATTSFALPKGFKLAKSGCRMLDFKSRLIDAAQINAETARKVMLKARHTAEVFLVTATYTVKKHPMKAVCCTFGSAFVLGAAAGWFGKRSN